MAQLRAELDGRSLRKELDAARKETGAMRQRMAVRAHERRRWGWKMLEDLRSYPLVMTNWLVVWDMTFIFPYMGNSHPN